MGIFGSPIEREIRQQVAALRKWDAKHLPDDGLQRDASFRTDSGTRISLSGCVIPAPEFMTGQPVGLISRLHFILHPEQNTGVLLKDVIRYLREEIKGAVSGYRDNLLKRKKLPREQRKDALFLRIDSVFKEHLSSLLLELQYFQPERRTDQSYLAAFADRIHVINMQLYQLNGAAGQYMYLINKSSLTDFSADQNAILTTVDTMEQTLHSVLTH